MTFTIENAVVTNWRIAKETISMTLFLKKAVYQSHFLKIIKIEKSVSIILLKNKIDK